MTAEIIGREPELRSVREFLGSAQGPAALVIHGEAGIGKSTLWLAGVEQARERGLHVLSARPAEAERELAYAGLADLLEPVLEEALPELPEPRRRALETALLLAEPEGPLDPRAVAVAVRSALELLAAEPPLLLALDDVQWLDPSSQAALAFALRRLDETPLLLLLARRGGHEPSALEKALGDATRLSVGPLSLGAIHTLLQARLGRVLSRPALLRLHETSGGNPFYALELARALGPEVDPTQPLPVPGTLEGLVEERLAGLPEPTRAALGLVAALARPTTALLERAGVDLAALEPALRAQVLERSDGRVRFTHPLLASVVYQQQSPEARRRTHRLLAALVEGPLSRARHLALAADGPDARIAAELEEAVAIATARGAPLAAAELAEHALRLTPPEDKESLHGRTIAAARTHLAFGDFARASALARELAASAPPGQRRIEALLLLADVHCDLHHDTVEWLRTFRGLLRETEDDRLLARIHERAAWLAGFTEGNRAAEAHARAALRSARAADDDAAVVSALGALAWSRYGAGKPGALELAEEACERARASDDAETVLIAERNREHVLLETGHLDEARRALERLEAEWSGRSEVELEHVFHARSICEFLAGEFRTGTAYSERRRELAHEYERENPAWLWDWAAHAAHRGEFDTARAIAERGRREEVGARGACEAVLGFVELWSGDPGTAVEHFAAAEQVRADTQVREPHAFWWRAEYVDALLAEGQIDDAETVLDAWEPDALRLERKRVLARIVRCRGLVAAARGEVEAALALLEEAVTLHERLGERYGAARALLALGTLRRRARQKRAAREAIEAALAGFEACGAEVFAAKARAELGSIGGRRREEGLTAAERRVADLVAEGKTNREVASILFLAERTVATHLSHVYAKLGVRSRTELARTLRPAS